MKKTLLLVAFALMGQLALAAPKIQQVEPLSWWTNMNMPLCTGKCTAVGRR